MIILWLLLLISPNNVTGSKFPCGKAFVPCPPSSIVGHRGFPPKQREVFPSLNENTVLDLEYDEVEPLPIEPSLVFKAIDQATIDIDYIHNVTEKTAWIDPADSDYLTWSILFGPDDYAKSLSYSTFVSEKMSKRIVQSGHPMSTMLHSAPLEEMKCVREEIVDCVAGKYRSYSGHCNNVMRPMWGASYEPLQRMFMSKYDDDVFVPRSKGNDGSSLPTPSSLSSLFLSHSAAPSHSDVSLLFVQWASFIYDDIVSTVPNHIAHGRASPLPCCRRGFTHPECLPLLYNDTNCLPYSRSLPTSLDKCLMGPREQTNSVSSFIDGSGIYGSTREKAQQLRLYREECLGEGIGEDWHSLHLGPHRNRYRGLWRPHRVIVHCYIPMSIPWFICFMNQLVSGLLDMNDSSDQLSLPKTNKDLRCKNGLCFNGGNSRMNVLPSSAALYTIWMRQHNIVVRKLKKVNVHWSDEKLYQESRRIVIAQIQYITYSSFLPILLGKENIIKNDLGLKPFGYSTSYDMKRDATTLNEFASSVGLFFIGLIPQTLGTVSINGTIQREESIADAFGDPSLLYYADGLEGTIRYLLHREAPQSGLRMSSELLNRAYPGLDAASWIIQMGRDHGLPSYGEWRKICGLQKIETFEELVNVLRPEVDLIRLKFHYSSPYDLDLFLGGLAEKTEKGSLLGPTFSCILARQFANTKLGDRFWFESFVFPSSFTDEQLDEIRRTSLSTILCETTGGRLGSIQMEPFMNQDEYTNFPLFCNSTNLPKINYKAWRDVEPDKKFPITRELLEKVLHLGLEQYNRLQKAEGKRINETGGSISPNSRSSAFSHSSLLAPKRESLDIAVTAGVLRETTKLLISGNFSLSEAGIPPNLEMSTLQMLLPEIDVTEVIGNFKPFLGFQNEVNRTKCLPQPLPCDKTNKYRSLSGWCNNVKFPHYGNSFQTLRRLLPPVYDDGFDSPRTKAKSGRQLPSARRISNKIHHDLPIFHAKFTHMLMQYGQILDHDMMHSPIARGANEAILNCSRCDSVNTLSIHCFPIPIDNDDPHFPPYHNDGSRRCMPFTRSLLGQVKLGYRNQLNQLSSFLDASTIYGSTECEMAKLRLFKQGKLNFTDLGFNREALPQGVQERDCRTLPSKMCFMAGDERNNEHPGLTVIHTIFMREHNRVAEQLSKINIFWEDERIFQEARRIVIAKLQHITYNEWLPIVLGWDTMSKYSLTPLRSGYYKDYDSHCDSGISQEMSTSAFRFGHSLVRDSFPRMNSSMQNDTIPVDLKNTFNAPRAVYERQHGHIESILMGLIGSNGMAFDRHVTSALRNHLFERPGGPLTGLDLPAVNIQRARDHGVPPYNEYREMCGLKRAKTFFDLADAMEWDTIRAFSETYESVDDIDLFPGIMSERPIKGALVGSTLGCLIGEQMQRLKKCDRFFYENDVENVRFTEAQLAEIRQTTMSKLVCANSYWASKIQPNVFLLPDELTNAPMSCEDIPSTDLQEWIDRQFCTIDHTLIELGSTKRITPCVSCTCTLQGTDCHTLTVDNCNGLLDDFPEDEVQKDAVCVIQCSEQMRLRRKRARTA